MSSQDIEAKLKIIFELGWRWGAVVLLDEADMILSKQDVSRTPTEAGKNHLIFYQMKRDQKTDNSKHSLDKWNTIKGYCSSPQTG